jgi:hypothetical protein
VEKKKKFEDSLFGKKGKVVPVLLFLTENYMKMYWRMELKLHAFLHFSTGWK